MNEILAKQLAIDFCTDVNSILSKENVFTEYKQLEGRRIFKEGECYFKAASVNGKIVASGRKDIIQWAREKFKTENGSASSVISESWVNVTFSMRLIPNQKTTG